MIITGLKDGDDIDANAGMTTFGKIVMLNSCRIFKYDRYAGTNALVTTSQLRLLVRIQLDPKESIAQPIERSNMSPKPLVVSFFCFENAECWFRLHLLEMNPSNLFLSALKHAANAVVTTSINCNVTTNLCRCMF